MLAAGKADVVRAQITGSIIGTSLFGLGLAIVVGSIGRDKQLFQRERAGQLSSLLILVVIALLLPAVFDFTGRNATERQVLELTDEELSLGVSAVLLVLYAANLVYTLVTHRDVFASEEPGDAEGAWPLWTALGVLSAATAAIALEAHLVSGALEATSGSAGVIADFSRGDRPCAGRHRSRPVRRLVVRPWQDGTCAQHLRRSGNSDRVGSGADPGAGCVVHGPSH